MKIAAAILAGGKASRLAGVAKGLLSRQGGVSLIQRLIDELAAAGIDEAILSANDPPRYAHFHKPIVEDLHSGIGPLAGIEAALHYWAARCDGVLFLPCDLPNIAAHQMRQLTEAWRHAPHRASVAETEDRLLHPLCAVVPGHALSEVTAAITAGRYGVSRLWEAMGAARVRMTDSARFLNVNTPADLNQWHYGTGNMGD
jgi:molybdopterin-guanine dinucleotide biosynthesis protein A